MDTRRKSVSGNNENRKFILFAVDFIGFIFKNYEVRVHRSSRV